MAGTSQYFTATRVRTSELIKSLCCFFFRVCVTGLMGQTTVAEPESRSTKNQNQRSKPDYATAGTCRPDMDTIMRVSH